MARRALELICARCPRLVGLCYWAGTAAVAIGDLEAYDDVSADDAKEARERLLGWLKETGNEA